MNSLENSIPEFSGGESKVIASSFLSSSTRREDKVIRKSILSSIVCKAKKKKPYTTSKLTIEKNSTPSN